MQVWNVLRAARWKYSTQKSPKSRHLGTIPQLCRAISSQLRHVSTIGKQFVKQQYNHSPYVLTIWWTSAHQRLRSVGEFGAPLKISTGFASWLRYCTAFQYWASAKLCGVEQRAPPIFGRRPSRWALAHILVFSVVDRELGTLRDPKLWVCVKVSFSPRNITVVDNEKLRRML